MWEVGVVPIESFAFRVNLKAYDDDYDGPPEMDGMLGLVRLVGEGWFKCYYIAW